MAKFGDKLHLDQGFPNGDDFSQSGGKGEGGIFFLSPRFKILGDKLI